MRGCPRGKRTPIDGPIFEGESWKRKFPTSTFEKVCRRFANSVTCSKESRAKLHVVLAHQSGEITESDSRTSLGGMGLCRRKSRRRCDRPCRSANMCTSGLVA